MSKLVIVESPTKAKTIKKFLGPDFKVESSFGHVRDLPQSAADIPAKYKGEEWAKLGVNVREDFEPLYVVPKDKKKIIKKLKEELKKADELYLATDEDREGESISWHLVELLKPTVPVKRMVFHEITKSAIEKSLKNPREIDQNLVEAQETRRILDRLVGYTVSPVIWKKIAYGLSAGRVQSAGLRMIVERERERLKFNKAGYWDILAELKKDEQEFEAKLVEINGKKIAKGSDFDDQGKLKSESKIILVDEKLAVETTKNIDNEKWIVASTQEKEFSTNPPIPFITSTLQQEGNRKLGLPARQTMRVAQGLYERGLITYMRTDSPNLSSQAVAGARSLVEKLYGKEYLTEKPRNFTARSKSAQEAHEAIRPAHHKFINPSMAGLSGVDLALYDLIWKKTLASQMKPAKKVTMTVGFEVKNAKFTSSGTRITFPGFLKTYTDGDGSNKRTLSQQDHLPELKKGDHVEKLALSPTPHETKPPARYTEAALVQNLEKQGIGRPSTYASIITTIINRGYVVRAGNALVPTFTGFAVIQLLEKHFSKLVDYKFTSAMEDSLDDIADGNTEMVPYLKKFFLGENGLEKQAKVKGDEIDAEEARTINLIPLKDFSIKIGRFGPYLIEKNADKKDDEKARASIPQNIAPGDITVEQIKQIIKAAQEGPRSVGDDPETGLPIYVMLGRFGPYVQLGETKKGKKSTPPGRGGKRDAGEKPKRASIPKDIDMNEITLEQAVKLLSLPRELGEHPETKKPVVASIGRFGPYVVHDGDFRSLKEDDPYTISLEKALEILAQEKKGRRGAKQLREVGDHPKTGKKIVIYDGKYGPYIKYGTKNASLPKGTDYEKLTVEEAVDLIKAKKKK